ncbi:hypothetical protein AB0M28_04995 [Streptomyces sp. NPDC051940]|uniref:hypothetical protein n=1 Tax=Streptomyces sp. NPDC051940 TaxID=3155675 RepID=UPI0034125ACF
MRLFVGSVLALLGAAAAVYSPFRPWYDGRLGQHYAVDDLFDGITDARSSLIGSIFLIMLAAAVVAVLGVLRRSRLVIGVAGLIVLGTLLLWMIRQGQISDGLSITTTGDGLGAGVAYAFGAAALMLLGAGVLGRQSRTARLSAVEPAAPPAYAAEPAARAHESQPENVVRFPDATGGQDLRQTADGSPPPQEHRDAA